MTELNRSQDVTRTLGYPYRQGELDPLSGIYSAVNAALGVIAPYCSMPDGFAHRLFRIAILHVSRRCALNVAMTRGIKPAIWHGTVRHLARFAGRSAGIAIQVECPFADAPAQQHDLDSAIDAALEQGATVLVALRTPAWHYTVVQARTSRYFRLRESADHRALPRSIAQARRDGDVRRINPRWLLVLRVAATHGAARAPP